MKTIYFDYSATTPVDPRVAAKMIPYLTEEFGNPASRSHPYGWTADKAVEDARAQVADLVGADPKEIVFTSGATESNNLVNEKPELLKQMEASLETVKKSWKESREGKDYEW